MERLRGKLMLFVYKGGAQAPGCTSTFERLRALYGDDDFDVPACRVTDIDCRCARCEPDPAKQYPWPEVEEFTRDGRLRTILAALAKETG